LDDADETQGVALGWLAGGPLAREEKGLDIESCPPIVSCTRDIIIRILRLDVFARHGIL
jgi:hypothetical protein